MNLLKFGKMMSFPKLPTVSREAFYIWAFGIAIVLGCDYMQWNQALTSGFCSLILATVLSGCAYIGFVLCSNETFSGLPFSGGVYGSVRCAVGFFPGFLVGCAETVEYLINTSFAVSTLSSSLCSSFQLSENLQLVFSLIIYVVFGSLLSFGPSTFWRISTFFALTALFITLLYCFSSLKWVDFPKNFPQSNAHFNGGFNSFLANALPISSYFYAGIESLTFACNIIPNPKTSIPTGALASILTLVVVSLFVVVVTCSIPYTGVDEFSTLQLPLNPGFSFIFNCSDRTATLISLPAQLGTIFGFMFAYGKLISSLADSKLFPIVLSRKFQSTEFPYAALLFGSIIGYFLCIVAFFFPVHLDTLFHVCMLSQYSTFIGQCIAYIFFKVRLGSIECSFKNPLGVWGAAYSIIIFLLCMISLGVLQDDQYTALTVFLVLYALLSVYYFTFVKSRQRFSAEEEKHMLTAHVINFNQKKAHNLQNKRQRSKKKSQKWTSSFIKLKFRESPKLNRKIFVEPRAPTQAVDPSLASPGHSITLKQ